MDPTEQGSTGGASSGYAPEHLDATGRALWTAVLTDYELTPAEVTLLSTACAQADTVTRLENAWAAEGYPMTARGSMGQLVAHPLVSEIRQHRSTLRQLLAGLRLPHPDDSPVDRTGRMTRTESARVAARARWSRGAA